MAKIKVTAPVINRAGKRYIAKDWIIEVDEKDLKEFKWFEQVKAKKVITKKPKNENNKKGS